MANIDYQKINVPIPITTEQSYMLIYQVIR
jgi:hypothetical protein